MRPALTSLLIVLCLGCSGTPEEPKPEDAVAETVDDAGTSPDPTDSTRGDEVDIPPPSPSDIEGDGNTGDVSDGHDASTPPETATEDIAGDTDEPLDVTPDGGADDGSGDDADAVPAACTAHVETPADFDHTFSWDAEGRLIGITWVFLPPLGPGPSEPKDSSATHDAEGRLLSTCCRHWPYPSGNAHHQYDTEGRHAGYEVVTPANPTATPWEQLDYTWHDDGTLATATRVTHITEETTESWSYVYAPDGALAQRSYSDWIEEVHYDEAGCLSHFLQKFLLPGDGPAELTITVAHDETGRLTAFGHPEQGTTSITWSEGCTLINQGVPTYPGIIDPRFPGLPTQLLPGRICPP